MKIEPWHISGTEYIQTLEILSTQIITNYNEIMKQTEQLRNSANE